MLLLNDCGTYKWYISTKIFIFLIPEVIKSGKNVLFEIVYNDPNWKRPAYRSYWHSTVSGGRWSYVPSRNHYALHRLFATYPTASVYYDFVHELGISEESKNFKLTYTEPFEKIVIVVMQAEVKMIRTLDNQVVLVASPKRDGLQVLTINSKEIPLYKPQETILFQLATPNGQEIDYTLIKTP